MTIQTCLTPHGRIACELAADEESISVAGLSETSQQAILAAFDRSPADGLLLLAGPTVRDRLPADLLFWREFARQFLQALCQLDQERLAQFTGDHGEAGLEPPDDLTLALVVSDAPPMRGLEYLTVPTLKQLWNELQSATVRNASETDGGLPKYLRQLNPWWHLLGRVTFHLAENKRDSERPFAFLATYTHRLSARAQPQHLPLAQALKQYAGEGDQAKLAELLEPVRSAAENSALAKELLTSRALFHPQAWSIDQAYRFLRDVPTFEQSGLVVRVPNWWKPRKPPRPSVRVTIGQKKAKTLGSAGLLDFSVDLALDGEPLTEAEMRHLLAASDGLMLLRGKWVEVDRKQLHEALEHWQKLEQANADGIGFLQGMRLLAGAPIEDDGQSIEAPNWTAVVAGDWLREILGQIRDPTGVVGCSPGEGLHATLRPYQADGVRWLWFMTRLGLGACLADDMGLGKTVQVIDLLLRFQESNRQENRPTLLVVPASLVGNWRAELSRFAPSLRVLYAHRSECDADTLDRIARNPAQELEQYDAVVSTYTLVRKSDWFRPVPWRIVVLDEAQAIKNPSSAQARSVKSLKASQRILLTGTPVENQLGDLWSLFDFCCPGLLGSAKQFKEFVKQVNKRQDSHGYSSLRRLVQPYILRRLKTDPLIVPDLPEKTEMRVDCGLTTQQAGLYQLVVTKLAEQLEQTEGIQRRGVVLSALLRLKQICNHPAQYVGNNDFKPDQSGKFVRLAAICEPIAARQEKVLVFSQFQAMCEPLAEYLQGVFGRPGVVLHGGVAVAKRKQLVQQFQEKDELAFFVISVKAGGVGLNLTAASHVVHFDRWWNPAVENQATDRAFRIGQKRNVLVHKFVCRGTVEERIDQMIRDKQELADQILAQGAEVRLTELSDQELLNFVALDIHRAAVE